MRATSQLSGVWLLIPARGGSVGVPRKNLRLLAGAPLIVHSIRTALEVLPRDRVIVITDSEEIADVASRSGSTVIVEETFTPPEETLDTKIIRNIPMLRSRGAIPSDIVVTMQPTSPLTRTATLTAAVELVRAGQHKSVITVAEDKHLRWRQDDAGHFMPQFGRRLNRQELPKEFRETGGVIAATLRDIDIHGTRVIDPVCALPVTDEEAIDIDSHADLYVAAHYMTRKKVAVRVDAARHLGMGHVYRALALATELARHHVRIFVSEEQELSRSFFRDKPYHIATVTDESDFAQKVREFGADLIFLDVLDTSEEFIQVLRTAVPDSRIVTFEDRGPGASKADLVVAEFVHPVDVGQERVLEGIEHSLLAPRFEIPLSFPRSGSLSVDEVLVLFGGTDPSGLAKLALSSLQRVDYRGHVTVVRGMGAAPLDFGEAVPFSYDLLEDVDNMPLLMAQADFAFTSAGRTIVELAAMGTPSVCLAQNAKELTHTHATSNNGVVALGLGTSVANSALDGVTLRFINDHSYRQELAHRAREAGRKRRNRRTLAEIFARLGFETFPDL